MHPSCLPPIGVGGLYFLFLTGDSRFLNQLFPRMGDLFIFVIYFVFIMKYGVPIEQFVNEFSDIEFEYRWFDNVADASAFARTVDMFWTDDDPSNEIITMGS